MAMPSDADTITGGEGNDTLIGGLGFDTAVFSFPRASYDVRFEGDKGWIQVNYAPSKLSPDRLQASAPEILKEMI
mgnify:CR=1 FL=1